MENKIMSTKSFFITSLKNAKPGDTVQIGAEGGRSKTFTKVKTVKYNGITMEDGNVFDDNGTILRRNNITGSHIVIATHSKKRVMVSARLVTQSFFDNQYKDIKTQFLSSYEWKSEDIDLINEIILKLKVTQGNELINSRF
jgi:hypothetical protein